MLRSDLCDYSDEYIVVKGLSNISKIKITFIDNEEDLDLSIPMYNLLEYSDNYSKSGTL